MRFDDEVKQKHRRSIKDAIATIVERGNDFHRRMMNEIVASEMMFQVKPLSEVHGASGRTGLISTVATNLRLTRERMSLREALGEIYILFAEETLASQRGCEGTLVHEGRHAYDFAQTLASLSNADMNPLDQFNPTLYELEWEAHKTAGDYMICIGKQEYLDEGLQLMILGLGADGSCFVSDDGIRQRLREGYGLSIDGEQGHLATRMMGIVV
jgi:hypothetical protein